MVRHTNHLSRCAGEVEARSDEGEGPAIRTVRLRAANRALRNGTMRSASPSPSPLRGSSPGSSARGHASPAQLEKC